MRIADHMGGQEQQGAIPQDPQQQPQDAAPQDPQQQALEGEPATEEEQKAYDGVMGAVSEIIYGEMSQQVVQMLQAGADDPAQAIADTAVMVILELDEKSKGTIPETVIIPAATEIAELLAELGQKQGIFEVDDMVLGRTGQLMLIELADAYGLEEEDLQEVVEGVDPKQLESIVQQQSQYGVV